MANFRPLELADYFAILRRRKWLIFCSLVIVAVGTYFIVRRMPDIYRSETLILVEQQKIPESFVKTTVQADLSIHLQTLADQVFSRTRLQSIVEAMNLFPKEGKASLDGVIAKLRKDIEITLVPRRDRPGVAGFRIGYEAESPELAQSVLQRITSLLIEENLRTREQQAVGTTRFLTSQLEGAREQLQEQEQLLREFKTRYFGELPQQQQTNLTLLGQFHTQLASNTDTLNRLEQENTYLSSLLVAQRNIREQQEKQLESLLAGRADPSGSVRARSGLNGPAARLRTLQALLVNLESRYTPDHPDVVSTRLEIERLQNALPQVQSEGAEGSDENAASVPPLPENPQDAQVQSRIESLKVAVGHARQERKDIQKQIRSLQSRVNVTPIREQQIADLTRDYDVAKNQYDDLLQKRNEAEMAADLERRQQGERFRILDPPSLPVSPIRPNRLLLNFAGIGMGLFLGLGLSAGAEFTADSFWNQRDITYYLNLPVLASVPRIPALEKKVRRVPPRSSPMAGTSITGRS